jgi:hypothetical protein
VVEVADSSNTYIFHPVVLFALLLGFPTLFTSTRTSASISQDTMLEMGENRFIMEHSRREMSVCSWVVGGLFNDWSPGKE